MSELRNILFSKLEIKVFLTDKETNIPFFLKIQFYRLSEQNINLVCGASLQTAGR